ncbi:MAG: FHA domain-containing protein [Planctomycetota bacterium]|nr:MAG: FHA domain-containing protein [Planctomycetota bacterium]
MELEIEVYSGNDAGRFYSLSGPGPFYAGTSSECDILFKDATISPIHGIFQGTGEGFLYIDNGSERGSFKEGERIQRAPLSGMTRLILGEVEIGVYVVPEGAVRREERIVFCKNCQRSVPLNDALASGHRPGEAAICNECIEGNQPSPGRVPGYELGEVIAQTPFSIRYKAREIESGQEKELDIFSPPGVTTRQTFERVVKDIETIAKLNHPLIYPPGVAGVAGDFCFRARDLLKGETLADRLGISADAGKQTEADKSNESPDEEKSGARIDSEEEIVRIARALAGALDAAHSAGIMHRDIHPRQVIFSPDGQVMLDGLGIAKHFQLASERSQESGLVLATEPAYLAPEQIRDPHNAGPCSDIYSLGAMIYRMIAGRPPFIADDEELLLEMIRIEPPPPISSGAAMIPETLDAVFTLALAKLPKDRPQTAADLVETLAQAYGFPPEL